MPVLAALVALLAACASPTIPEGGATVHALSSPLVVMADIIAALGTRAAPEAHESTVRWDLATVEQLEDFHEAARDIAGLAGDEGVLDALSSLASTFTPPAGAPYDPFSPAVLAALLTLNASSFAGVVPRFDPDTGHLREISDLGWVARGFEPTAATDAFISAHDAELSTVLGLTADHSFLYAGTRPRHDHEVVTYLLECNGIEVEGDAMFFGVTNAEHWLGAGVVDRFDSWIAPDVTCPLAASDVLSEADAMMAALAHFPAAPLTPADLSASLFIRPPGTYLWHVWGVFGPDTTAVDIDASSGALLEEYGPDHESGWVAQNLLLGGGTQIPGDIMANYPLKYVRVLEDGSLLAEADGTGYWSEPAGGGALGCFVESTPRARRSYEARGTYWADSTGDQCERDVWPSFASLVGSGTTELVHPPDIVRTFYLHGWTRELYSFWQYEVPEKVGITPGSGFVGKAFSCGSKWSTFFATSGDGTDNSFSSPFHEGAGHVFQHCASKAGWGCKSPPRYRNNTWYRANLGAIYEGHADWIARHLSGYRVDYGKTWNSARYFAGQGAPTDWFLDDDEVGNGPCTTDGDCASGEICSFQYGSSLKICLTACSTSAACRSIYGPAALCKTYGTAPAPTARGCRWDSYRNGTVLGNAYTFLSLWLGPMEGFDVVSAGYAKGWKKKGSPDTIVDRREA